MKDQDKFVGSHWPGEDVVVLPEGAEETAEQLAAECPFIAIHILDNNGNWVVKDVENARTWAIVRADPGSCCRVWYAD